MALLPKDEFLAQLEPTSGVAIASDQECPVCYDPIVESTLTSCRHVFCFECLKQWLTSAHTCPSCRQELYEKPPDDEDDDSESEEYDDDDSDDEEDEEDEESDNEEWHDDGGEERVLDWPEFDFDYDRQAVRQTLQAYLDIGLNDATLSCSLQSQAFINYDRLLTAMVAGVVACIWSPKTHIMEAAGPEFTQGWKTIASAIESVLSQLRQQTLSGTQLFLSIEKEVQRTLRGPANQSLFDRQHAVEDQLKASYIYLEACVVVVLRQVVHAGYEANAAADLQAAPELSASMSAFTDVPYVVHPHDLQAAFEQHTRLVKSIPIPTLAPFLLAGAQTYVSKSLLLPTLLAAANESGPMQAVQYVQRGELDLADMYVKALPIITNGCITALIMLNGHTMEWSVLLKRLTRIGILDFEQEWQEEDGVADGFHEQRAKLLGTIGNSLYLLLMPCILTAIRLHDETQLPPVDTEIHDNIAPTIEQASES